MSATFPRNPPWSCALASCVALAATNVIAAEARDAGPWRLSEAAGMPGWLQVSGTHRTRYETLDGQFRAGRSGDDQMLALRTTLKVEAKSKRFSVAGELIDSRQWLADAGTPIDTTMVDAVDLLQGYAAMRFDGAFVDDSRSELRIGRQTLDMGSRRLVARNEFRNTINAFTGLHYQWEAKVGPTVRAFYLLPVIRLPSDPLSLLDNDIELDEGRTDLQFWGLYAHWPRWGWGATGEVYVLGLHETDSPDLPTRNREIYTPGLRLLRKPARHAWDFELESALQFGTMRNSTAPTDTRDLDHFALFSHAELGYTFSGPWSPRVAVLYDYASGDKSPTDDESNRFDTLFGARRFDHGPTGIYGAFARSNIQSAGIRLSGRRDARLDGMLAWRPYWLASDRDAWTTSGLRDPSGNAESFIGHQLEARLRWDFLPGNARADLGGAYIFAGDFIKRAPNATSQDDTAYGYLAVEITF